MKSKATKKLKIACVYVCVFLQTFGILKCALARNAARAVNSQLKHFVSERLFSLFSLFGN